MINATEDLWRAIADRDLGALVQVLNDRTVLKEVAMENPKTKTLEITVKVPRDSVPVKLAVMKCGHCGMLCALEKQFSVECPYCQVDELMDFDPTVDRDFTGYGYRDKKDSEEK